ncbi:hypothetical protein ACPYO6_08235 [Georgenia sp. Z1344]|uniref:hypothetical protein n=1 Tax=Georgenia sp. Z1344 TaxID=3416706 RepID=UPI003CF1F1A8
MSPGALGAGLLVALAVLLLAPPPRRVRRLARRASGVAGVGAARGRRGRVRRARLDPGLLVSEVAMRLRAGSDPARAWALALDRSGIATPAGAASGVSTVGASAASRGAPTVGSAGASSGGARAASSGTPVRGAVLDDSGVPVELISLAERLGVGRRGARPGAGPGAGGDPSGGRPGLGRREGPRLGSRAERASARGALAGVVAACRVTHATGAPLAEILDRSASGIAESARAAGARTVALAGPRATGRLLGWLPLLGLLLGAAVGADPVAVLLDGGIGTVCLVLGLTFLVAGWWWVLREERRAETADA